MIRQLFKLTLCFQLFLLASIAGASTVAAPSPQTQAAFNKLVDNYFDFYFQFQPTQATQAGFHQYDTKLEDFSLSAVEAEIAGLEKFQKQFGGIQSNELPQESAGDLEILTSAIRARLLELQSIQMWRKNPDLYTSDLSDSIFVIMRRNFATPEERLRSLVARELQAPKVLEAARQNLRNPPQVYTQVALQQLPDTIQFFQKDVPEAFRAVKDPELLARFKQSNDAVVEALRNFQTFLQDNLLPASNGDFRLGADNFSKKLLYDEMVDIPSRSPAGDRLCRLAAQPGAPQASRGPDRSRSTPRSRSWPICEKATRSPTSCCKLSATLWVVCVSSSSKRKSSPSLPPCRRSWKRRRPSSAH